MEHVSFENYFCSLLYYFHPLVICISEGAEVMKQENGINVIFEVLILPIPPLVFLWDSDSLCMYTLHAYDWCGAYGVDCTYIDILITNETLLIVNGSTKLLMLLLCMQKKIGNFFNICWYVIDRYLKELLIIIMT